MVEIKDLTGLSQPLTRLIEVTSEGIGAWVKPYISKRIADADAYKIQKLSKAIADNSQSAKIEYDKDGIVISKFGDSPGQVPSHKTLDDRAKLSTAHIESRRQANHERVIAAAAAELEDESDVPDEKPDADWTYRFFEYAASANSEEIQKLWGKVLAGEIKRPKSYSLRTLETLRSISTEDAEALEYISSYVVHTEQESFIVNPNDWATETHQIPFLLMKQLNDAGLLNLNKLSLSIQFPDNKTEPIIFKAGHRVLIVFSNSSITELNLGIYALTKTGSELLSLTARRHREEALQLLGKSLEAKGLIFELGTVVEEGLDSGFRYIPDSKIGT
ncbi:DUF2806 domain-containing protein [Hoeflea sp. TYP-13]|uniref:DUF2806 domain-containing protein n=1 Tax=Hoeflea sp. TYP-13 TaxID=3230023 RepID=UPI0034C62D64